VLIVALRALSNRSLFSLCRTNYSGGVMWSNVISGLMRSMDSYTFERAYSKTHFHESPMQSPIRSQGRLGAASQDSRAGFEVPCPCETPPGAPTLTCVLRLYRASAFACWGQPAFLTPQPSVWTHASVTNPASQYLYMFLIQQIHLQHASHA